jgi:hypothetical protein
MPPGAPVSVLVLRVWDEAGLRARVVAFEDGDDELELPWLPQPHGKAAARADEVCRIVRSWAVTKRRR